eukprot:2074603-Rhodomonas_salina.1
MSRPTAASASWSSACPDAARLLGASVRSWTAPGTLSSSSSSVSGKSELARVSLLVVACEGRVPNTTARACRC